MPKGSSFEKRSLDSYDDYFEYSQELVQQIADQKLRYTAKIKIYLDRIQSCHDENRLSVHRLDITSNICKGYMATAKQLEQTYATKSKNRMK